MGGEGKEEFKCYQKRMLCLHQSFIHSTQRTSHFFNSKSINIDKEKNNSPNTEFYSILDERYQIEHVNHTKIITNFHYFLVRLINNAAVFDEFPKNLVFPRIEQVDSYNLWKLDRINCCLCVTLTCF